MRGAAVVLLALLVIPFVQYGNPLTWKFIYAVDGNVQCRSPYSQCIEVTFGALCDTSSYSTHNCGTAPFNYTWSFSDCACSYKYPNSTITHIFNITTDHVFEQVTLIVQDSTGNSGSSVNIQVCVGSGCIPQNNDLLAWSFVGISISLVFGGLTYATIMKKRKEKRKK